MKKVWRLLAVITVALSLNCGMFLSFAQSGAENFGLQVGDAFVYEGEEYTVYLVDEDGAHITKDGIIPIAGSCPPHHYVVGKTSVTYTKLDNNSSVCYKKRTTGLQTCTKCGDKTVADLSYKNYPHKFNLKNQCTNQVNGSKCTYHK